VPSLTSRSFAVTRYFTCSYSQYLQDDLRRKHLYEACHLPLEWMLWKRLSGVLHVSLMHV